MVLHRGANWGVVVLLLDGVVAVDANHRGTVRDAAQHVGLDGGIVDAVGAIVGKPSVVVASSALERANC
eukprot:3550127-Pyramimonas_sp.AAC.1